jgi:hypothetical protein
MYVWRWQIVMLVLLAVLALPLRALAADGKAPPSTIAPDQAVEAGRDALQGRTDYPWYDRAADDVRRLPVAPPKSDELPNRQSRWSAKANPSNNAKPATRQSGSALAPVLQGLGITLLVALLVTIAVLIARAALRQEVSGEQGAAVVEVSHDVDRVENLPFQVKKPISDFLSEAERLYQAGEYSEAILYLFSYQLVQLDRQHVIRLAKGKTNRQYLREMRNRPALRGMLEGTMVAFEDVFFGRHTLDRDRFEVCWRQMDAFRGELQRVEQLAA